MFDPNPKDIEFAARQLANTHSHISYEQALEDMQQSADERQGDMQYAMLQAIGAVEVNDFIPDAIIYSPKEEQEQKPVEEMTLDELWPPVNQLASFMQKVNKTNGQLWANKEFPFYSAINENITAWLDRVRPHMGDSIQDTIENLDTLRREFVSFGVSPETADRAIYTISFELHMEQREHEHVVLENMAGGSRDLSSECLDEQRGLPVRRSWFPAESDAFAWAAKTDETRRFKLPAYNGEHLAYNKHEAMEYHTKTQRWLVSRTKVMGFLRAQINKAIGDHKKQAMLLNTFKYCRNQVEEKRKEICRLRFGFKLQEPKTWNIYKYNMPRAWRSFETKGFTHQPMPKLNAHLWAMLMNQANVCLGNKKCYDLPALREFNGGN